MALHRNIGYIREDGLPPTDDLVLYPIDPREEVIVIDQYYPKDPILPAYLDEEQNGGGGGIVTEDQLQTVSTGTLQETEITNLTSYARGIVFADANRSPIKSIVQLVDLSTGVPVSAAQEIEAGHQFLIWTNNPDYRAITIKAEGFKTIGVPFNQFANLYPGALEVYLQKEGSNVMLIAAAAGLFLLVARKKKKGVGKVDVYKYYQDLPPVAKGILTVGGAYILYKTLDKILKPGDPNINEPQEAAQELQQLAQQGIFPTYSDAQFESFSNAIVQAIWDCGTDESAIFNVMDALRNKADVLRLIQVYGVREYKGCFENFFGLVSRSLSGAISSELDASEKSEINHMFSSKGINFSFA